MRRTLSLLAGALVLSGCTPNSLIELLYPKCKQEHTSCETARQNPAPFDTDTSHWSNPIVPTIPIDDTVPIPRDRDTTLAPPRDRD